MVYFECSKCNESVKKPKLAKHLEACRSHYVSCIDCSKVFGWDEWEAHTSCISEAQKYQGNLFQAKESSNKGQVKQDTWVENVQKRIEDPEAGVSPQTRTLLQKLLGFTNIPRKQKPFGNFVKNSLKIWDEKKIGEMWEVIFAANASASKGSTAAAAANANEGAGGNGAAAAARPSTEGAVAAAAGQEVNRWLGWLHALDEELEASGGELPWQRLRDALVARRCQCGEVNGSSEEELGCQALGEIPEAYLSSEDALVRLPAKRQRR